MDKRFFVQKENFLDDKTIKLVDEEHIHLSKVLRLRQGEDVECFCDGGDVLNCKIVEISKNYSVLEILSSTQVNTNPKVNVTLFQALPKLDKLELVTQKVTELGVSNIIPFVSTYCIAKENINKIERLKKIVVSACKQCGRTKLTEIGNTIKFSQLLENLKSYDIVFFANETENNSTINQVLLAAKNSGKNLKNVAYVVGSEGGFSQEEVKSLTSLENVFSVSLGNRILRTETAGIVLAGIILYELGEI